MLIVDQLRSTDRRLRSIAAVLLSGMFLLSAGLWYVQFVARDRFEESQKNQSFRTVRLPAIRGKILDRNGVALAQNEPDYNINLYLEELRPLFLDQYEALKAAYNPQNPRIRLRGARMREVERLARFAVVSNITDEVSRALELGLALTEEKFHKHYIDFRYVPLQIVQDLDPRQIALFVERSMALPGIDLDIQPLRVYPHGTMAAHLIGHLKRDDRPDPDDEYTFKYPLPDYIGMVGIERAFDDKLRGVRGRKLIRVNNLSYRVDEEVWPEPVPGANVVLTIDARLQRAVERALANAGPDEVTRGAAVVMDVKNGDILAMASAPSFDPELFVSGMSSQAWEELMDPELLPLVNRATKGYYPPASIVKMIVGLACLEAGVVDPTVKHAFPGFYKNESLLGKKRIKDDAGPGEFDFVTALAKSSNAYFIHFGLLAGIDKIVEVGRRFGLGQATGLATGEENAGYFPPEGGGRPGEKGDRYRKQKNGTPWLAGDTANICIGQGDFAVTPLQAAVMTAAIANGGMVFKPRVVRQVERQDALLPEDIESHPPEVVRRARIQPEHLKILHAGMLEDVEHPRSTGYPARIPGYKICGKTGTAQVLRRVDGVRRDDHITWFVSFAPFEDPEYAVVVVVESGRSGGKTCAPVAKKIYEAIRAMPLRGQGGAVLALSE